MEPCDGLYGDGLGGGHTYGGAGAQDAAPSDCRIDIQRMEPCNGLGGRGLETGQSGKGLRRSNEAKMPQPK